jgi:hypothetical protein
MAYRISSEKSPNESFSKEIWVSLLRVESSKVITGKKDIDSTLVNEVGTYDVIEKIPLKTNYWTKEKS